MLTIQSTELLAGVRVSGDYWDLDELFNALHQIVGDDNRYYDYLGARQRILVVCYNIKQAIHGERNVELIANGLNKSIKKEQQLLAPDKNIYYSFEILWPEALFITIALNDFIKLHEERFDNTGWNMHIAVCRKLQASINNCLRELLAQEHYFAFWELMKTKRPTVFRYVTQFVDILNLQYLQLSREERAESLSGFLFKLILEDEEYMEIRKQLLETANITKNPIHELEFDIHYPETIEW